MFLAVSVDTLAGHGPARATEAALAWLLDGARR
jgi:hypothetical protein